jgi:hypothetical protein
MATSCDDWVRITLLFGTPGPWSANAKRGFASLAPEKAMPRVAGHSWMPPMVASVRHLAVTATGNSMPVDWRVLG